MASMARFVSRLVLAMALFVLGSGVAHASSPVEGRWHTPNREGTVEVSIHDGVLTGTLVESTNAKATLGSIILSGFVLEGDTWVGKLYAPKRGKRMDAKLRLKNGELTIEVSSGLRSKSVVWTRA